jgi:hypothetical protein
VSLSSPAVLGSAWPQFLQGAGIDATDPELPDRVRCLQVLRMLELLADERRLAPDEARRRRPPAGDARVSPAT